MSYRTNTVYGTWTNRVSTFSPSPDADVSDYINGGDADWRETLEESGALDQIKSEYHDAINAALPDSISLCGNDFIGPWEPEDGEFDGYPTNEFGDLDFAAMVEDIDLGEIVERNEPLTAEYIGRWELKSQAKDPAKVASSTMKRLGVKPFHYLPHPESGRPQALYRAGEVRDAIANRPGQGSRTDLPETP
ncbi:hypothetical protein [Streptomyces platensis]|uniref:hypothetical protein n=1 Tax=Streptomyces platensis TaxID=58346 RepID=UPI00331F6B01